MEFIETPIFTRQVLELLTDESYRALQAVLNEHPDLGDLIVGGGGLRKVRWMIPGRGKRGGVRVIYYWFTSHNRLLMLYMYPKSQQDDLTYDQLKLLRQIAERELR